MWWLHLTIYVLVLAPDHVEAFRIKVEREKILSTWEAAKQFCETKLQDGALATWEDIAEHYKLARPKTETVWDGHSYSLSPLISIKSCTILSGSHKTYQLLEHGGWPDAAARCQGLCRNHTYFAVRRNKCACLSDYTQTAESDCLSLLHANTVTNPEVQLYTVFETVDGSDVDGNDDDDKQCIAKENESSCQSIKFRKCSGQPNLHMLCSDGMTSKGGLTWEDAGYNCIRDNLFPHPLSKTCSNNGDKWLGGFRRLQSSAYTTSSHCMRITYSRSTVSSVNMCDRTKCSSSSSQAQFYCRFYEPEYNEPCTDEDICAYALVCNDETKTCLCKDDQYWNPIDNLCLPKTEFNGICDATLNGTCISNLACIPTPNGDVCLCTEEYYWDEWRCKQVSYYRESCNSDRQCFRTLLCTDNENDSGKCFCSNSTFWNSTGRYCEQKRDYGTICPGVTDSCKSNLECVNFECTCQNNEFWEESNDFCSERAGYEEDCVATSADSCLEGLDCDNTTEGYRCLCANDWTFHAGQCQKPSLYPSLLNTTMKVEEAKKECERSDAKLPSVVDMTNTFEECGNNSQLSSILDNDSCITIQFSDGIISSELVNNCVESPQVVCVKLGLSGDELCQGFGTSGTTKQKGFKRDDNQVIIIACVVAGVVVLGVIVAIAVICKRKRTRSRPKKKKAEVSYNKKQDTAKINMDNHNYDEAVLTADDGRQAKVGGNLDGTYGVLGQKPQSSNEDMYSHTRQHQMGEGEYDVFTKTKTEGLSDIYDHTQNFKQQNDGEYGVLGEKKAASPVDDTYSHTRHYQKEGDYEVFSNPKSSKDTGDIYDHAHNVTMENLYGAFSGGTGNAPVEDIYDHT